MSVDIRLKHSSQAGKVPDAGSLKSGEVAINTRDVKAYIKNADGQVVQIAGADNPSNDGRYLRIDSGAGAQTVESTDTTTFNGTAEFAGEVLCDVTSGVLGLSVRGNTTEGQNLAMFSDTVADQRSRLFISCSDEGVTLRSSNTAATGRDLIIDTGANQLRVDGSASFA